MKPLVVLGLVLAAVAALLVALLSFSKTGASPEAPPGAAAPGGRGATTRPAEPDSPLRERTLEVNHKPSAPKLKFENHPASHGGR